MVCFHKRAIILLIQNINYEKIYVFQQQIYNLFFYNLMEILLFFLKVAFLTFTLVHVDDLVWVS